MQSNLFSVIVHNCRVFSLTIPNLAAELNAERKIWSVFKKKHIAMNNQSRERHCLELVFYEQLLVV